MAINISAAVLDNASDVIDGYGKNASPCPSEPLWLQGTLILEKPRDLVIPDCQSRTPWTGGNHRLRRTAKVDDCKLSLRFHKSSKKTGLNRYRGSAVSKEGQKKR